MPKRKKPDVKFLVTELLAKMMQAELRSICPEESMSHSLGEYQEYEIREVRFEDEELVIAIDSPKGPRELVLVPKEWRQGHEIRRPSRDELMSEYMRS